MATLLPWLLLFGAAFAAGMINSVAGGGSLLTFPSLLSVGVAPLAANATSTVALVPGSAGAFWGYRQEIRKDGRVLVAIAVPSCLGGGLGAMAALGAGDRLFARLVPWLLLAATVLFVLQGPIARRIGRGGSDLEAPLGPRGLALLSTFQFVVALYGGFFGAGIGILMLAALGIAGMHDIHRMNAFKNFGAVCINGVATATFVASGRVQWAHAGVMALGAVLGGFGGASVAKRIGQTRVRWIVVAVGLAITAWMFARTFRGN